LASCNREGSHNLVVVTQFRDLEHLPEGRVLENLGRAAGRPVDLDPLDSPRIAKTNELLQGIPAKAASRRHMAVNRSRHVTRRHHFDSRADRRAIRLHADKPDRNPGIVMAGILKEDVVKLVSIDGTPGLNEQIGVAVAVPVATGLRRFGRLRTVILSPGRSSIEGLFTVTPLT
jgi:hypothetical protein